MSGVHYLKLRAKWCGKMVQIWVVKSVTCESTRICSRGFYQIAAQRRRACNRDRESIVPTNGQLANLS
jgi:hypothetical protein